MALRPASCLKRQLACDHSPLLWTSSKSRLVVSRLACRSKAQVATMAGICTRAAVPPLHVRVRREHGRVLFSTVNRPRQQAVFQSHFSAHRLLSPPIGNWRYVSASPRICRCTLDRNILPASESSHQRRRRRRRRLRQAQAPPRLPRAGTPPHHHHHPTRAKGPLL